jgi:dipeptidyl aminopeptidase/acylaminoacyl peptidase
LNHGDYDSWKSIQKANLSGNGQWVAYEINPQEGDGEIVVESPSRIREVVIARGYDGQFSADGAYFVAKIKPQLEKVRQAKKAKVKPDKMPKDSLVVLRLADGQKRLYPNVLSYALAVDAGNWLAFLTQKAEMPKDTAKKATRTKKTETPKGDILTLLNMAGRDSVSYEGVSEYAISDQGNRVIYTNEFLKDTTLLRGVYTFDIPAQKIGLLDSSSTVKVYTNVTVDKKGNSAAWMSSLDSTKAEVKRFSLLMRSFGKGVNTLVVDSKSKEFADAWSPSSYRKPRFSDDGSRLYFGVAPIALPSLKDTTLLDSELSRVDVWNWQDKRLQPMQSAQKKRDVENTYWALFDVNSKKIVPLANEKVADVDLNFKANTLFVLGTSNEDYQLIGSWDPGHSDYYLVNTQTGTKTLIGKDIMGRAGLSPAGKYAHWFDERDSLWRVYNPATSSLIDLTGNIPVAFYDEEHDTPDNPGAYGLAGWTPDDKYMLVYDRYDIWQIDPTQQEKPVNITNGYGRKAKVQLRYMEVVQDEQFVDLSKTNLLWGQWESDKETGILQWKKGSEPEVITKEAFYYSANSVARAKNADVYIFQKGNYTHPNELYMVNNWKLPKKLSNLVSQLDGLKWGNAELVSWVSNQGTTLEGLLFKPEGFDPTKKYPMLVYYYERNATTLHAFRAPAPSRSTINIPFCVSNDYLVFVPDIVYSGGTPGKNAYDCIVSGVLDLTKKGFVDRERIGIQGQSWGGYQTAYLITQTNLFRAAMAGAIVANMTSAYGGIRWGTGLSRMFQYEKTQSRVGGTLWEKPMYYIENSPLFYADRVETPLLMMHNDADGSVPWYQGIEFFTALRRLNKPAWMLVYNDEDHNLTRRPNMKDLSTRMYQFFDYYLKDTPSPSWMSTGRTFIEKERWDMKYK